MGAAEFCHSMYYICILRESIESAASIFIIRFVRIRQNYCCCHTNVSTAFEYLCTIDDDPSFHDTITTKYLYASINYKY